MGGSYLGCLLLPSRKGTEWESTTVVTCVWGIPLSVLLSIDVVFVQNPLYIHLGRILHVPRPAHAMNKETLSKIKSNATLALPPKINLRCPTSCHLGLSPVPEDDRNMTLLVPPALPNSPKYFCFSSLLDFSALACLARSIMPSTHLAFCSGRADFFPLEGPASPTSPVFCLLGGRDTFAVEGRELPEDDLGVDPMMGVCLPAVLGVERPFEGSWNDQSFSLSLLDGRGVPTEGATGDFALLNSALPLGLRDDGADVTVCTSRLPSETVRLP